MALHTPPRLLLLSAFLLAHAPTILGLADDSRLSFSSVSLRPWKSACGKEGQRYQIRTILHPSGTQAARHLTAVAGKRMADEIHSSEREIRSQSDANVGVKSEGKVLEQMGNANRKLLRKRMAKEGIEQKPNGSKTFERSEGANSSSFPNEAPGASPSDSAGEAQDDEKTKEVNEDVAPDGKGRRDGPLSRDSPPPESGNDLVPPPIEMGGAGNHNGNPGPDTKKDDTKEPEMGTQDKLDPDSRKDDIENQDKGTPDSDSIQDSSAKQKTECEESHCQDADKVLSACLRTSGDGSHMLSLSITNEGGDNVTATVFAPKFLRADPSELLVKMGTSETVQIFMDSKIEARVLDVKGAKSMNIRITSGHGECGIAVPIEYLLSSTKQGHLSYSSLHTPMAGIYALIFLLVMTAGIWLYCRYRGRKRSSNDVNYQELEMNVSGVSTPKERGIKSKGESSDGWDQIWDDDWEDTEAVRSSSRLSQSLSSRGLAARRGNKDGWDSSWDD